MAHGRTCKTLLVLAEGEYGDVILCQITSKSKKDPEAVELKEKDFQQGKLKITSYIRPRKIFAAEFTLVLYKIAKIKKEKITETEDVLCRILKE